MKRSAIVNLCFYPFIYYLKMSKYLHTSITGIYSQNQYREGTLHMRHRKVGDQMVEVLLVVVVVVQHPRLVGLGSQMLQIQSLQKQSAVPQQETERLAGWRWEIWSVGLKRIWHPNKPVGKKAVVVILLILFFFFLIFPGK